MNTDETRLALRIAAFGFYALACSGCGKAPVVTATVDMATAVDPINAFLPALPEASGTVVGAAGVLTADNFQKESVPGPASQGLVGDYYMRNDKVRLVIQAPGRALGVVPFGGNLIDADTVMNPAGDQIGEVGRIYQLGRTVNFTSGEVLLDGSAGGPVALRFRGHDALDSYFNLPGIGGLLQAINSDFRADVDLGMEVVVTYVLNPGATYLEATYTCYNPGDGDNNQYGIATTHGTISDTGAQIEAFHPHVGFGEDSITDLLSVANAPLVEYGVLQGQGIAYGILPRLGDDSKRGASLAVAGVSVELFDLKNRSDLIGAAGQTLVIPPKMATTESVEILIGSDAGDIEAQVRARKGQATIAVAGTVARASGTMLAGARVAVEDTTLDPTIALVTAYTTDANGAWKGALPPGSYRFTAESTDYLRSDPSTVVLATGGAAATVNLSVPNPSLVNYKIHDGAGNALPAKVVLVGARASVADRRFRAVTGDAIDSFPLGVANWMTSLTGDSTKNTRYDHPLSVAPGRYRVFVQRGPEYNRYEKLLDLTAGDASIDVTLERVIDTAGYVGCDFHQHTYYSPDSPVPPSDRIVGYLAEGLEFAASTDHDTHYDFAPLVDALGARGWLDTIVGVEVTPWDYGHFMAYPVPVDRLSPNGGALDWGQSPVDQLDLSPGEIFAGLRLLGTVTSPVVVQMNHPRAAPGASQYDNFQKNFDRAGLTYDFVNRSFGGSEQLAPLKAAELGLPDGADLFSSDFDALEVYNGTGYRHVLEGDERVDPLTEYILRDYMNFLSFGFVPVATGNSDSHNWFASPPGLPRSMVRVPSDSTAAITAGLGSDVMGTLHGSHDVVVTNTPMISFTVDGVGIGGTDTLKAEGPLSLVLRVQTPDWAPVDTIEIFANNTFDLPVADGQDLPVLIPAICYTTRATPSQRCSTAPGGARPFTFTAVAVGTSERQEVTLRTTAMPADLIATQRAGARGKDLWLMARVSGEVGLFPTLPDGIQSADDVTSIVEGTPVTNRGVPSLAFTNPILVDVDGNGWKAPFAP